MNSYKTLEEQGSSTSAAYARAGDVARGPGGGAYERTTPQRHTNSPPTTQSQTTRPQQVPPEPTALAKPNSSPTGFESVLAKIRATFNLKPVELARACKAPSYEVLMDWAAAGAIPLEEVSHRVFILWVLVEDWTERGFVFDREEMCKPLVDEQSVLDMLTEENLNREKIMFAGSRQTVMLSPLRRIEPLFPNKREAQWKG